MRLRRLAVRELRRYRDLELELAPGLTVIRGPNEAGKTTVQRAIELALTRRVTSSAADLEAARPWDAGAEARTEIELEFETDDEDGGIHPGRLRKAFRGQRGTVELAFDGQTITDPAVADQVLAELTGIPSEAFFRSTASVRHHEVDDLDRDEAALRDRLQASISGADRGTSRARKKLEKALYDLTTRGTKNPGQLKVAETAIAGEQAAVEQGELALAQLERDRDTLTGARERRRETAAALETSRAMLEKARQAERLQAERAVATERFDRYRQAVDTRDRIEELEGSHPSEVPVVALRQTVGKLRIADGRIRELEAILADEVEVKFEVATPEPTWRPTAAVALLAVIGGAALAIATELGILGVSDGLIIGLIVLVVGAGLALVARRQRARALDWRRQTQLRETEIDRRLRGRSTLEEELKQTQAAAARLLLSIEQPDLATAEDLLSREEAHIHEIERLKAQLDGLVGKEPRETLGDVRDAAALLIEQKTAALEALGPIAKEPRARERLEVEVHDGEVGLDRARDDEAHAKARVEANAVDADQVAGHAERLAMWREQLAALQRRVRVYEATLAAIDRAEQATMKTVTRFLEARMGRDVALVTGGRYRRLAVDDKTLDLRVHAPEKGDWVDLRELSQGTIDLVYLAARLGLVRLVTGDRRPPLVFDDPFVTLDDERATRAIGLLKTLAADFQVIYLTTSTRYDAVADRVVVLDGPTELDPIGAAGEAAPDPAPERRTA